MMRAIALISIIRLIHWGGNVTLLDRSGFAPIHYCVRENIIPCVVEFLTSSDSIGHTRTNKNQTLLHIASKFGCIESIQILCRWDGDSRIGSGLMEIRDDQGKTAPQLLRHHASLDCFDNIWNLSRRGNAIRYGLPKTV
jgi:ankyrin repeat protein